MNGKYNYDTVEKNLIQIRKNIEEAAKASGRTAEDVKLLCATKTVDADTINFAISKGVKYIGENRVQELLEKYDAIDKENVEIHFIGRLQTNKVKYIIDKVSMIESLDSVKLAREIDKHAKRIGKVMDVLVEVNIGREEQKGGVMPEDLEEFIREISTFEGIKVRGLMTIAPKSDDKTKIFKYFCETYQYFIDISQKNVHNISMEILSMGMSSSFEEAIRAGSTEIRLGTTLFGERIY